MAYQLNFDGVNGYVSIPTFTQSLTFTLELEFVYHTKSGYTMWASAWPGGDGRWYIGSEDNELRIFSGTGGAYNGVTLVDGQVYTVRLEGSAGSLEIYLDGALQKTLTGITVLDQIGRFGASLDDRYYSPFELRWISYADGTNNWYYDASASNGTGQILPETTAGADGTLVRFPADDSQWVFYAAVPTTPINLGTINLQATSARLTWEQG